MFKRSVPVKTYKPTSGFTIVEIMIALAIVAIFVTMPILAYSNYARSQRDIKRKSDINQIQQVLEQYKASTGTYPTTDNFDTVLVTNGYLPELPKDPTEGKTVSGTDLLYTYEYLSEDGSSYQISTLLENKDKTAGTNEVSYYVATPAGPGIVSTPPGDESGAGAPTRIPVATNTGIPTLTAVPPSVTRVPTATATP
jgi:prepilin-type N-terminal cleavage/methylation domain-containing protein